MEDKIYKLTEQEKDEFTEYMEKYNDFYGFNEEISKSSRGSRG